MFGLYFRQVHYVLVDQPAQHVIDNTPHSHNYQRIGILHDLFPESGIKMKMNLSQFFLQDEESEYTAAEIADQVINNAGVFVAVQDRPETIRVAGRHPGYDTQEQHDHEDIHDHTGHSGKSIAPGPVFLPETGKSKRTYRVKKNDAGHPVDIFRVLVQAGPGGNGILKKKKGGGEQDRGSKQGY